MKYKKGEKERNGKKEELSKVSKPIHSHKSLKQL